MFLLCSIGGNRYAIDVRRIAEILPLLPVTRIPHLPHGLIGVLTYHDRPLPIVDLSVLVHNGPTSCRLSTRLIVVDYPNRMRPGQFLGLMAEHVMSTFRGGPDRLADSDTTQALPTRPMIAGSAGIVQQLDVARLLSPEMRCALDDLV